MQPQDTPSPAPEALQQPAPQPPQQPSNEPSSNMAHNPKTNVMAIVGLVLAFIVPVLGFILSLVAKSQIKKTGEGGKGLATAGIIVSVVLFILQVVFIVLLVLGGIVAQQDSNSTKSSSSSSTSNSSSSSTTDTSSYSVDEKKAVASSEAFLKAIQKGDYSTAYNLLGPELKKEYPGGQAEFQKEVEGANLKLIKSWNISSATTNGSNDRITVEGTASFSGANPKGSVEFGYYKDTDGSIKMYLWQIKPSS